MNYRDLFIGVGLDSSELGFPAANFKQVFKMAGDAGLHRVAHAGEEGPAIYIWQALDDLGVERIDHGNNAIDDPALMKRLARDCIPLTMCPLSNKELQVVPDLAQHQARTFLDMGIMVTLNSDDPAYFGGYVNDNYLAMSGSLGEIEFIQIAQNSLDARFIK